MRLLFCWLVLAGVTASISAQAPREVRNFNGDWAFLKADAPGAEQPGFDDGSWRKVAVPHDWAIEGPFDRNAPEGQAEPFYPRASAGIASGSPFPRRTRDVTSLLFSTV